jgi:hypothetical protein
MKKKRKEKHTEKSLGEKITPLSSTESKDDVETVFRDMVLICEEKVNILKLFLTIYLFWKKLSFFFKK